MGALDLGGALNLLDQARNSLSRPPSDAAAWRGQQPHQQPPGQWQHQERIRAALTVMHTQLAALDAAFRAQPGNIRRLARYHRAVREEQERRQHDHFLASWDYAEGA